MRICWYRSCSLLNSALISSVLSSMSFCSELNFFRMMPFSPLSRRDWSRSVVRRASYFSLSSSISRSASSSTCRRVSSSSLSRSSFSSLFRCSVNCSSCSLYSYSSVSSCTSLSWDSTSSEFCSSQRSLSSSFSSCSCWYRSTSAMSFCWNWFSTAARLAAPRSSMVLIRSSYSISMSFFSCRSISVRIFSASFSWANFSVISLILSWCVRSLRRSWYSFCSVSSSTFCFRSFIIAVFSSRSDLVTRISSA
mmetsp:Transcript_155/g.485  ORF Transcript_155/g.485 Transcript_155/m.485 type:complete len:251 (+) Transcript_155:1661-2413(+)